VILQEIYATKGVKALENFLSTEGVKNVNAVNAALKTATPGSRSWWSTGALAISATASAN
jgi:hypothetical protein